MKNLFIIWFICITAHAQNGIVKSFYSNGTPRSEISYVNDILDGMMIRYFPNGNIMSEKNFSNGILHGTVREFYDSGLIKEEFSVDNGVINGTRKIYYSNGSLKSVAIYDYGQLKQNDSFEYDPNYSALPKDYLAGNRQQELLKKRKQEILCDVDICPFPIGGLKTIYDNLVYPEHALLYGLEGTVTLIASIDEKGDVINSEVIKHLGLGCDEAAKDAVKKTKFIPGQKANKIVKSNVTLNIEFKIIDRTFAMNGNNNAKTKDVNKNTDDELKIIQEVPKVTVDIDNKNGKESFAGDSNEITKSKVLILCDDADECPYPQEGEKSIRNNLFIPFIAKRLKLTGEIIVEAHINKYGIVDNTKLISGIGYGCDEAVESAIMRTKFIPGKKSGAEVNSKIIVKYPFNYEE